MNATTLSPDARLTPLVGGHAVFDAVCAEIGRAVRRIDVTMFIWRGDALGHRVGAALVDAADRGVRVTVRKDPLGSIHERSEEDGTSFFPRPASFAAWLAARLLRTAYSRVIDGRHHRPSPQDADAKARFLSHPRIRLSYRMLRRDHSKCFVFDDETLILGGMNIEGKFLTHDVLGRPWRDYMLAIRSPLLAAGFRRRRRVSASVEGHLVTLLPGVGHGRIRDCLKGLLDAARREVLLEMAYFGDPVLTDALARAASRGVRVRVLSAAFPNIQADLNRSALRSLLRRAGGAIEVYLSQEMIHSKLLVVDRRAAYLGSGNFNGSYVRDSAAVLETPTGSEPLEQLAASITAGIDKSTPVQRPDDLGVRRTMRFLERLGAGFRFWSPLGQ